MRLERLDVFGLFGRHDLKLDLTISPLFLVGPNGTGKSTCLTILHCLLTAQWQRLSKLPFDHLECGFAGRKITLDVDDVQSLALFPSLFTPMASRPRSSILPADFEDAKRFIRRSHPIAVDAEKVERLRTRYDDLSFLFNLGLSSEKRSVLFYPTYRRIERDLRDLVDLDEDFGTIDVDQSVKARFDSFGEVIGFGGQDIKRLIDDAAGRIESAARQSLNEQSVKFIDVLNKRETVRSAPLRDKVTDPETISRLIDRINTFAPNTVDTSLLFDNLNLLRRKNVGRITSKEEILVYYISEMLNVMDRFDRLSDPLSQFAEYMSAYLKPTKRAEFNERNFRIEILNDSGGIVNLDSLSSGEKQILSLFSFLMFSDEPRGRTLIIDEPELSLSVTWQKRLVDDLLKTGRPTTFICATHSPFIFENFDLENVMSLGDL